MRDSGRGLLYGSAFAIAICLVCSFGSAAYGALNSTSPSQSGAPAPPIDDSADAANYDALAGFFADKCPEAAPDSKRAWCDRIMAWELDGKTAKVITTLETPDELDSAARVLCATVSGFWLYPTGRTPNIAVTETLVVDSRGRVLSRRSGLARTC